ncbi:MAG TPA: hypothetical protein PKI60_00425 [Oscillospiraceae bacterium]|nr:hypothetical protein [Oscillospiraceae bacterium]
MKKSTKKRVVIFSVIALILLMILNLIFGYTSIIKFYFHKNDFQKIAEYILTHSSETSYLDISYNSLDAFKENNGFKFYRITENESGHGTEVTEIQPKKEILSLVNNIKKGNLACIEYLDDNSVNFYYGINTNIVYSRHTNKDEIPLEDRQRIDSIIQLSENWFWFDLNDNELLY